MAADKAAAVASGADVGDGLRQRPVAASQATSQPQFAQPEDNKKLAKKVRYLAIHDIGMQCANYISRRSPSSTSSTSGRLSLPR